MGRSKRRGIVKTMEAMATAGIWTRALPPKTAIGAGAIGHTTTKSRRKATVIVTNRFNRGCLATHKYTKLQSRTEPD